MALGTRAQRQRDIAATIQPSVEAVSDSARSLSDNIHFGYNQEPNGNDYEPNKTENLQRRQTSFTPPNEGDEDYGRYWLEGRLVSRKEFEEDLRKTFEDGKNLVLVNAVEMIIPETYDPDTYDPERRMPWTPEPESDSPEEVYAAWGRKHFGEEWYEQRKTMLQERNVYVEHGDAIYRERQRALRIIEHKVEGRPFEPQGRLLHDEGWKRLWARLSKDLPSAESGDKPTSPLPQTDSDTETDLSGYDTYPPTPEPRVPTPLSDDPWERLENNRIRFQWDEERYQFEKIFLKEAMIDGARNLREDEPGDRQRAETLEAIQKVRYLPNSLMKSREYSLAMECFNRRAQGLTEEQIVAEGGLTEEQIKAIGQKDREAWEESQKKVQEGIVSSQGPVTQEEIDAVHRVWDALGVSPEERVELARVYRINLEPGPRIDEADNPASKQVPKPQGRSSSQKHIPRKKRGGGITKNNTKTQNSLLQGTQSRQPKLTSTKVSAPGQLSTRPKRMLNEPDQNSTRASPQLRNRQRKTYKKERSSRRLAGELPEFGLLQGQREEVPIYGVFLPSITNKTSGSGPSNRKLLMKPAVAEVARPQGTSKLKKDAAGRSKKLTKQQGLKKQGQGV